MTQSIAPAPPLNIRGLTKTFGSTTVLHGVDLHIGPGEFVGLMGPNGAGKSTLIKILDGVHTASGGTIRVGDETVSSLGGRSDVGFIHQDLGLVESMSVLDNLRLGERPLRTFGPLLDHRAERAAALAALERVGLTWAVDELVAALAPGEQALVAIARAFGRGARILFVDEATSTLPVADAARVIAALRENAAQGATIVMVTHKLHEILDATHRVVVLLDGRLAADQVTAGMDRAALVDLLLQHEAAKVERVPRGADTTAGRDGAAPVLEISGAFAGRAGPVDLVLRRGEVLGLTGLPGSGLHDIAFLAHGSLRPARGTVRRGDGVRVAIVPPHRETQGGFDHLSVHENITLSSLGNWTTKLRLLALGREKRDSAEMVERLNVQPPGIDTPFGVLSGGNKQKVIFGRALLQRPAVYVLCEPTRGVDVGTRSEIYRLIEELRDTDAAVLVVTSDSEDLFAVCDAVAVVEDGRLSESRPIEHMQPADLEVMV
ncbi:sugar ABC transporter ATP-binding protein [Paraconexibacter antarcticus]|uniref:Sugar ABC transporter ATP-binding protein n=1 Tax=Paraconexibacter antarcticus TaxID=2949664 RepID=A0ABY5DSR5_9ACTN|nr:sugar ABC transporter ATP-binding protein [Paraconexibacter antarcticus]UTI64288.1 sugar ABC transporter ATP-binding protein [Paraconexibacter antarcticus]